MAPASELHFERLAVTPDQIVGYGLPTRPTKASDSRSRTFTGESVEVDAIPAPQLRRLVGAAIEAHIDPQELDRLRSIEEAERDTLRDMATSFGGGTGSR
jgi:hypothetical protein